MAASKARSYTVAGCPFSACASLALPGGHARGGARPCGAVSLTTQRVATRAAAAAPVGGGGGRGREELPHPPRADAAARCPAPPTPLHAVADRLVVGVNARPQRRPPVRRACDPRGAGAADVRPPPGAGVATLPLHVRGGGEGGWRRWRVCLPPFVAPVRSGWQQRWRVRPLVGSRAGPRLLLPPLATGSQAVGAGSAQGGRRSLDGRTDSAKGAPRGVAATVARPPPLDRLAPRRGRSWGEEARGGGREPRRQSGRGSCPAPWRGAGNGSGRVCRGRVLACCRGMPCLGLIAMTLHVHYVPKYGSPWSNSYCVQLSNRTLTLLDKPLAATVTSDE